MAGIALGAASFCVVFWVDVLWLKGIRTVQPVLWVSSIALFAAGLLLCLRHPGVLPLPLPVHALGWVLSIVFGALLVYSLFVEIPLFQTPLHVVSWGTYALCRHPGVLWLAALLAALFLARGSLWLLLAAPVWMSFDVLYAMLQEKLFFVPLFGPKYQAYQHKVPMFIPTFRSVRECARTIFRRAESGTDENEG
jgi:hypothetical protein